jgi:hypothetical protein
LIAASGIHDGSDSLDRPQSAVERIPFKAFHLESSAPIITIEAIANNEGQLIIPYHCAEALSTDG